ncbi:MAG: beta-N-acetylhexosaminidase [Limnochordia bacterium]|jgi:beta-N-acetylhexosaminidase
MGVYTGSLARCGRQMGMTSKARVTLRGALVIVILLALGIGLFRVRRIPTVEQGLVDRLSQMSLEERVGQMVMAGFPGYDLSAEANELIAKHFIGGVMLASRNIRDLEQTAELTGRLQRLATTTGAELPLLIAADQEGGYVVRLQGRHAFPGNMALGAAGSPELTQRVAAAMGRELRSVGINMNFAPVVDVNSNPANPVIGIRSFGEDPQAVSRLGVAYITGLHEGGVLSTAKHFPGHGDTSLDSHIALPRVAHLRTRLEQVEFVPFKAAIGAGVTAIMTAHVTFPAIEPQPGVPATLSKRVLTDLLRQELGFDGLIITDAMEMGAIARNFGLGEAAVRSVQAGADVVLVAWPSDWRQPIRVVEALVSAVREGVIPEERVNASVRRILAAKEQIAGATKPQSLTRAQTQEAALVSKQAAAAAITVVRDAQARLPLTGNGGRLLVVGPTLANQQSPARRLAEALRPQVSGVDEAIIALNPDKVARAQIVARSREYANVILITHQAWSTVGANQVALVEELVAAGREPIVLSVREPYDLLRFPAIGTFVACYSANGESMQAAAEVIAGQAEGSGRLPVSLPGLYSIGHRK